MLCGIAPCVSGPVSVRLERETRIAGVLEKIRSMIDEDGRDVYAMLHHLEAELSK